LTTNKNEKLNDFSKGDNDFNLSSLSKLLNITHFPKESDIKNNIFKTNILLETILSDIERLEQCIDSLQRNQALLRKDLVEAGVLKLKI
jgi:hypothetical protein